MSTPCAGVCELEVDGVPVVTEAFPRTVRLVTTARLREAVLKPLVDNEDELALLSEIEGATSARQMAQERGIAGLAANELVYDVPHAQFINASFAYAKPRQPNRFNGAHRGAWYAALTVETCLREVGFHLTNALADAGDFNGHFRRLSGRQCAGRARARGRTQRHHLSVRPAPGGHLPGRAAAGRRPIGATGRGLSHGLAWPAGTADRRAAVTTGRARIPQSLPRLRHDRLWTACRTPATSCFRLKLQSLTAGKVVLTLPDPTTMLRATKRAPRKLREKAGRGERADGKTARYRRSAGQRQRGDA
jgi:hypothetical protein